MGAKSSNCANVPALGVDGETAKQREIVSSANFSGNCTISVRTHP